MTGDTRDIELLLFNDDDFRKRKIVLNCRVALTRRYMDSHTYITIHTHTHTHTQARARTYGKKGAQ